VSTSTAGTGTAAPALSTRRRWTILVVCAFALFLVGLDTTIVTVGLGEIGRGLAVVPGRIAWVVDAYTVPFASLLVTSGSIADRFGRRRVFRAGLVVFALASLACSAAPSLGVLVAMRAVQGVRASMLTPVALAIVVNAMPDPRERAQAIGVWGAMFGLSMAAGPVTGGALLAVFDWRALFWINAPVVALALLFTVWFVPESRAAARRRIDVPGQMLLILTLAAGVAVLIEGPRVGWTAPPVLLAGAVLLLAAVVFIAVETRRHEPLLDPGLFRVPSFAAAITGAIAVFVAFSMTLLLTTSLLQDGEGWTALAAGAATLPMAAAATICAPVSGYLVGRIGARPPLLVGSVCLLGGGLLLTCLAAGAGLALLLTAYTVIGVGVGFANAPITNTAVNGLPPERAGVASGTASTARQVGTAIGIALAGGLTAVARGSGAPGVDMLPGWLGVVACGLVLLGCAAAAPGRPRPSRPGSGLVTAFRRGGDAR
jgi:EmrB/QacA subfamily drug resistance transporter